MVFGTTTFKCDECGNKFIGMAAERTQGQVSVSLK